MFSRLLPTVLVASIFMLLAVPLVSATSEADDITAKPIVPAPARADGKVQPFEVAEPSSSPASVELPEAQSLTQRPILPQVNSPDTTACLQKGYADWAHASNFVTFPRRSDHSNREIAMRFDPPSQVQHSIRINGVYNWIYRVAEGAAGDGTVKVVVKIYYDAGKPGNLFYQETFVLPVHANTFDYTYFPFSTPVEIPYSYHISFGPDPTGPSTDTVVFTSDDAGYPGGTAVSARRGYMYDGLTGTWKTAYSYYGGSFNPNFDMVADYCEFYSSCYTAYELPPPYELGKLTVPDSDWPDGSTLNGLAQRFVPYVAETLKTVLVPHWDMGGYTASSTNGLIVSIYPDSAGTIKYSAGPLASITLPPGIGLFPHSGFVGAGGYNQVGVDFSPFNLIVRSPYHVAVQTTGNDPAAGVFTFAMTYEVSGPDYTDGSGASVNFAPPGNPWERTGSSGSWLASGGTETAFLVYAAVCKDEFYACRSKKTYQQDANQLFTLPVSMAAKIRGGLATRIEKIRFQVSPDIGAPDIRVKVWQDGGAVGPGAVLFDSLVPLVTYYPGWTEVVIPGGAQAGMDFYVGYENASADPSSDRFYFCGERDRGTSVNGGAWYFSPADARWKRLSSTSGHQDNAVIEVDYCEIPDDCCPCGLPDNFATAGYNFSRTGHTSTALSDAACDLSLKWSYHSPSVLSGSGTPESDRILYTTPIVYEDYVIMSFSGSYRIFDLATGALLRAISGAGSPTYIAASGIQSTPTVAVVTVSGVPKPLLFVAGGSTGSISAYDLSDPSFPQVWLITNATPGYAAVSSTQFANFVVSGNTLYWTESNGAVYASDATTGTRMWGPVTLGSSPMGGLAFDGTYLFVSTAASPPAVPHGDVFSIDAATGIVRWQLSSTGGLRGSQDETFPSGLAVDQGEVFTVSTSASMPVWPADGLLYRIRAYDGSVLSTTSAPHIENASGVHRQAGILLSDSKVIVAGGSAWLYSPEGGILAAYNRFTGEPLYTTGWEQGEAGQAYLGDGLLTCERSGSDIMIFFDSYGYLRFAAIDNGREMFSRRVDYTGAAGASSTFNRGAGVALSKTGDLVVASHLGGVYCLTKQEPRPRVDILEFTATAQASGNFSSVILTLPRLFANMGCVPLTGTLHFSDVSNGSLPGLVASSEGRANLLTDNASKFTATFARYAGNREFTVGGRELRSPAAASAPIWLNTPTAVPFVVDAYDTSSIVIDVNPTLLTRGPNRLYVQVESNDPDHILNDPSAQPEIEITVQGGCQVDTTHLRFGAGGANVQVVANSGRLASGNWGPASGAPGSFAFDGFKTGLYQGSYAYGVSQRRIAINTRGWYVGGGENTAWLSLQANPNPCSDDCKPAREGGISLGNISTDGMTYSPLVGNAVCREYIDSVLMYDASGRWNWEDHDDAYFSEDSTMGLLVRSRVVAVTDPPASYPQLRNVTVDYMKIFPRNGQPVPDWKLMLLADCDIQYSDTAGIDRSISTVWVFPLPGSIRGNVIGWTKLPFSNCRSDAYEPVKNVRALNAAFSTMQFADTAAGRSPFLDSLYIWGSMPPGASSQGAIVSSTDQALFATVAEHSFSGSDTLELAMAQFGLTNVDAPEDSNNYRALATMLNKWVGFGRGDVNNDGALNLADIIYLADNVGGSGPGPIPFAHLGDVDASGATNMADVTYLVNYYFHYGACPVGKFIEY